MIFCSLSVGVLPDIYRTCPIAFAKYSAPLFRNRPLRRIYIMDKLGTKGLEPLTTGL